jgi:hypothetical protein
MSSTEAGFLDATPIEPGAMVDIVWIEHGLDKAIAGADAFWSRHVANPKIAKILTGVIHAYFLAQARCLLPFEVYLYTAFDGCHAVREMIAGRVPHHTRHGDRIRSLCVAFGIVADSAGANVSSWADAPANVQPAVTTVRNNALHEGVFFDEPLGFQGFSDSKLSPHILGEMTALVSRFIVALLELPATDYIRSSIKSRQNHGVRL